MKLKKLLNKLFKKLVEFYNTKEVKIFFEYLLPSAVITFGVDYLTKLEVNNVLLAFGVNLVLIFLRQIKPRYERLKK